MIALTKAEDDKQPLPQRDYLAVTSHDIRTLMTSIIGMTDLLLDTELSDAQAQYIDRFRRAGNTMLWLIDNVLELSRMEAGQVRLQAAPFDLQEVLDNVSAILSVRAEQKGLELAVSVSPEVPPRLVGDAQRLGQILLNLISNAIKFTDQGRVVVSVDAADRGLRLVVTDTGRGIPADLIDLVFERYSPSASDTDGKRGTGLGLTIVHRLVQLMKGSIDVDQPAEGGARFTVQLPLQAAPAPAMPPPPPPPPPTGGRPPARRTTTRKPDQAALAPETDTPPSRVLLAEDSPDTRVLIQHFLRKTQHALEVAENGQQALEKVKTSHFDVVFMDIQMPVMDGFEATAAIREWEEDQGRDLVPIVALTAHAMTHDRSRCIAAGCTDYLPKPVRKGQILELIAKHAKPHDT